MSNKFSDIRQSTPVDDIMGDPPSRISRWGTSVFGIVLLIILSASWFIKMPYRVFGEAVITTEIPPANLMARVSGRIVELLVREGESVSRGDLLSVMESTTDYSNIVWLSSILDTMQVGNSGSTETKRLIGPFPDNSNLGELQEYYSRFRKSVLDYNNNIVTDLYGRRVKSLGEEIDNLNRYILGLKASERLYEKSLEIEYNKYKRDSVLYLEDAATKAGLEQTQQNYLKVGIELEQIRLEKLAKESEKLSRQQEVQEYLALGGEEREKFWAVMDAEYLNLMAKIDWWYQTYLIQSPIDGRVTFNKFWGENQIVKEGETIMTVVPEGENVIIARVILSAKGAGKVEPGQRVNIRLNGYPYMEYGMVEGRVLSKSLVTTENSYLLDVELPNKLITFYGKELEFTQSMTGTAEVITDDQRLIKRLIDPFKLLITKNNRQ